MKEEDIVELTKRATEVFEQENVKFKSDVTQQIVQLDRTQWIRVMTNLIQNGIQSVPAEKPTQIKVQIKVDGKWVEVHVKDNGQGILSQNKDKIFEPKFTTKTKGMGPGLGIVKNNITPHNGSITFQSKKGSGSTFVVKIPID